MREGHAPGTRRSAAARAAARSCFAPLAPLLEALKSPPFPPVLFLEGDDDWILAEGCRRLVAAFRAARPDGEVSEYEAQGNGVREAVADANTIALFATNRLVLVDVTDLLRGRRLTADEVDRLLDEAEEADSGDAGAGAGSRALDRLARKARSLVQAAGVSVEDPAEAARKACGKVRRAARAPALAALLARIAGDDAEDETAAARLLDYVERAGQGDNVLLVHAVGPDPQHDLARALRAPSRFASLACESDADRRERLADVGLERCLERGVSVDPEVFEVLSDRGRLSARPFLLELDRLIAGVPGGRVTAEAAARLVADERKEYGSDFVEAVAKRDFPLALDVLARLLTSEDFAAFRPWGKDAAPAPVDGGGAKKGPKGEAAFFPLLGLLAGDLRRMLAIKAAIVEGVPGAAVANPSPAVLRRADYRRFTDDVLPSLRAPAAGRAGLRLDGHPFVLHRSYLASFDWALDELVDALRALAAVDAGVKGGDGSGPELLEGWVLSRVRPAAVAARRARAGRG